ncbi:fimbrial protein [Pseudomonas sp. JDS08PS003]|uniref:fimbrial protein n=1 Tax=Pseudomonas sp. JDS08PS003 TaxID=2497162 RepID=UPI0038578CD2
MTRLRRAAVLPAALLSACSLWQCTAWAAICSGTAQETPYRLLERSIPRDAPIGTTIFKDEIKGGSFVVTCGSISSFNMSMELMGVGVDTGNNVFSTGIPGVGVRVFWFSPPEANSPDGTYIGRRRIESLSRGFEFNKKFNVPHRFTFELIKTGPITSGNTKNLKMEIWYSDFRSNLIDLSNFTLTQKNIGCRPDRPVDNILLPTARQQSFTQIGSATGAKAFSIDLKCDKGVKVAYLIDSPHRQSDILLNGTGAEMATGVGIQLFKGDTSSSVPQPLGVRSNLTAVPTNQDEERVAIPLTARYVQTDALVTGGHVKANAVVTLIYE